MKFQPKFLTYIPYVLFSTFILFFVLRLWVLTTDTFDVGGIEQNVIYSIQVYLDKGILYWSPSEAPFSITQYTPLFYYLCSFTAKVLNHSGHYDIQFLYTIGRSWNIIFNLITAFLIYKIGKSFFSLSKNKSYFLFLLSFSLNSLLNYAARPDSLSDVFAVASIYIFLYYQNKKDLNFSGCFLTVLFTALSVFSKQSGIQLIVIFGGFLFLTGNWKALIRITICAIIIYGGFLLLFTKLYDSFLDNTVGGISNGVNLEWFFSYIIKRPIFLVSCLPVILIFLFLLFKNKFLLKGTLNEKFLSLCVFGMLVFASITGLKMGSGVNYYVLFMNTSLIFILKFLNIELGPEYGLKRYANLPVLIMVYLFSLTFVYGGYHFWVINNLNTKPDYIAQRIATRKVADFIENDGIAQHKKYVFANLTTNAVIPSRQGLNNMLYKYCLVPTMDVIEVSTGPSKVLGYNNFEKMLESGQVEYIIESDPETPFLTILENLKAIRQSKFKLVKTIDGYLIYKYQQNP